MSLTTLDKNAEQKPVFLVEEPASSQVPNHLLFDVDLVPKGV
jgi:hypothetical protein